MNEQEQMQLLHEMFDPSLLRLGPGTEASTLKALEIAAAARPSPTTTAQGGQPRVLDLGCGTGAQSLILARQLGEKILAMDNHQPYLDALRRRAEAAGVSERIVPLLGDMRTMEFDEGAFDLIWSEGAIFCMGFLDGLVKCRKWLAPGGILALTEICWLRADVPRDCRDFLLNLYPPTMDIADSLAAVRERGYVVVDHFTLPKSAWSEEYYRPMEKRLKLLRPRCTGDPDRLAMIEMIQAEMDGYRKYSDYYGYVFFILKC